MKEDEMRMEYSDQEIAFVAFCSERLACETRQGDRCPLYEPCDEVCGEKGEDSRLCLQIVIKMQNKEELTEEEKQVIDFFCRPDQWRKSGKNCCTKFDGAQCTNRSLCDERDKSEQKHPCDELLDRLGLYQGEELEVLEREIEKIIINNLGSIDWGIGEELQYYDRERLIAEINGRVDILLQGQRSQTLYVVELKPSCADRHHVGQLQSYVGWYKKNLPLPFKAVKGILLAKKLDEGARYAILANPDLEARFFELHIQVKKDWSVRY